MPITIGPFPKDAPHTQTGQVLEFDDGFLDLLTGTPEHWPREEKLKRATSKALPLAHLVPHMNRRPPTRPEKLFDHLV